MYVCGPTVYSEVHLGNLRTFLFFDVLYKYLKTIGYSVCYVRNITDVGHLHAERGTDKIQETARKKAIAPMQVANHYTRHFHEMAQLYNLSPPTIEPVATGHLTEQIAYVQSLLARGYAYHRRGSVYFDVAKYNKKHHYGMLSNRKIEELLVRTRPELQGTDDKKGPHDFALWKSAPEGHLMRWPSPWGEGFPGWHLECSVMSSLYLGNSFDIHGGGVDLKFPHHDCEIAQAVACHGSVPATYWLHVNMLTHQSQKMSKSLNNAHWAKLHRTKGGTSEEGTAAWHSAYEALAAYNYPAMRFYLLQTHYTDTLDFSPDALRAATKGYHKLLHGFRLLQGWSHHAKEDDIAAPKPPSDLDKRIRTLCWACYQAMNDDLNSPRALAALFELNKVISTLPHTPEAKEQLATGTLHWLHHTFRTFFEEVLDVVPRGMQNHHTYAPQTIHALLRVLLTQYGLWKKEKKYDRIDEIRAALAEVGISIQDEKDGSLRWSFRE